MAADEPTSGDPLNRLRGRRLSTALLLTGVAGFVDIFAYLALYHEFVANMSGNSVDVGMRLAQLDWAQVFHRALPVVAFVAGLVACEIAVKVAQRSGVRRILETTLTLEALCLAAFLSLGTRILGPHPHPAGEPGAAAASLVALAAFAMGTQNAALRAAGVLNVYTTHITGTLTRMSHRFVQFLARAYDQARTSTLSPRLLDDPFLRQALYLGALWLIYVAGATVGALCWMHLGILSLLGPIFAIGLAAALAFSAR